jgi:hypothetical protein
MVSLDNNAAKRQIRGPVVTRKNAGGSRNGDTARNWGTDTSASFARRLGKSAAELGDTGGRDGCPDIWELSNGDIAVVGRDVTAAYKGRLPVDVTVAGDERVLVIPRNMLIAAKPDIPDA